MSQIIQLKRSLTAGIVPSASAITAGELALNIPDKKLYIKDEYDKVVPLLYDIDGGTFEYVVDPFNGYEYVDLGLSVKWATMNVGATGTTDAGLYFQWGDTVGYTADQVGSGDGKKPFSWDDYKYGTSRNFNKYNSSDNKTVLELKDDAARANMGGDWRMPTQAECQELIDNCTSSFTNSSITFTSNINGNELVFPAAGLANDGSLDSIGSNGYYCSSSLYSSIVNNAWGLNFNSRLVSVNGYSRYYGFPVRGVQ